MLMYRPNVCIVITNQKQTEVLMFHRMGVVEHGWQFPQGGVDSGETEEEAFFRELKEEIGTNDVKLLKVSENHVRYKFPQWVLDQWALRKGKKKKYSGQEQRWYLVRLNQGVEAISFDAHPAEFDAYEWVATENALERIIPFKRDAYQQGLKLLGMLD
ncbi:MAG: RNA pyrophosphohydrolase [SAR324 cluster bacterium]|nr:RNA pyrophosphohydrolase [SAR324 cluster bacterium]